MVATDMISYLGYRVETAPNGEEAVERISRGERPSLIILDVIMPGMGGLEAFRRMRAMAPNVPVLVSSGYADRGYIDTLLSEGVEGFIHKPYHMEELAERIRRLIK